MNENEKIKNTVFSGLIWKFGERILAQSVSFIVSVVLARLLLPENYGTVALVNIFICLANVFITSGFSTALIQKKDASDLDFSTNFYCSFFVSVIIYIILFVAAPYISAFYSSSELTMILRVFSLRLPIAAYNSIQQAYVSRHMIFKKFFFSTLFGTVVSGVVGIILAYNGFGVWALIVQYLTNTIVDSIVLTVTVPWHPRFEFSVSSAKSMMKYGWKVLAADLTGTVFDQLRSLIIGRVYTTSDLAYYNKGKSLPDLLTTNISSSVMTVLFPAISNVSDKKDVVKSMTRRAVKLSSYVLFPLLFGLAAVARPLIVILYTEKWLDAVPFVQLLSISSAIGILSSVSLQSMKAIGRSDKLLSLEYIKKPVFLILLIIGVRISVLAIAVTMLIYSFYATAVNSGPLKELISYDYKEQVYDLGMPFILSTVMAVIVYSLSFLPFSNLILLIFQVLTGAFFYIAVSWFLKLESFSFILNFVRNKIKK